MEEEVEEEDDDEEEEEVEEAGVESVPEEVEYEVRCRLLRRLAEICVQILAPCKTYLLSAVIL